MNVVGSGPVPYINTTDSTLAPAKCADRAGIEAQSPGSIGGVFELLSGIIEHVIDRSESRALQLR